MKFLSMSDPEARERLRQLTQPRMPNRCEYGTPGSCSIHGCQFGDESEACK